MEENAVNIFEILKEYICQVFGFGEKMLPFAEYNGWHFIILIFGSMLFITLTILVAVLAIYIVWHILKFIFRLFQTIFSAKKRCSKIVCSSCGRTLDKCVCEKNKHRSYIRRLSLYSKEKKDAQRAKKAALRKAKEETR